MCVVVEEEEQRGGATGTLMTPLSVITSPSFGQTSRTDWHVKFPQSPSPVLHVKYFIPFAMFLLHIQNQGQLLRHQLDCTQNTPHLYPSWFQLICPGLSVIRGQELHWLGLQTATRGSSLQHRGWATDRPYLAWTEHENFKYILIVKRLFWARQVIHVIYKVQLFSLLPAMFSKCQALCPSSWPPACPSEPEVQHPKMFSCNFWLV